MNQAFLAFMDDGIHHFVQEELRLAADDRGDEAIFARVKKNVYDVFRTVYLAGEKAGQGEVFFAEKLRSISDNWMKSYRQAVEFGDSRRAYIEKIKLSARDEIRREFDSQRRDEP